MIVVMFSVVGGVVFASRKMCSLTSNNNVSRYLIRSFHYGLSYYYHLKMTFLTTIGCTPHLGKTMDSSLCDSIFYLEKKMETIAGKTVYVTHSVCLYIKLRIVGIKY